VRKLAALRCHRTQMGPNNPMAWIDEDEARRCEGVGAHREAEGTARERIGALPSQQTGRSRGGEAPRQPDLREISREHAARLDRSCSAPRHMTRPAADVDFARRFPPSTVLPTARATACATM